MRYIICLFLVGIFASCYQKKDGCLDPLANNFDPSADNTCCCNFPKLQFKLALNWGTDVFRYDQKYTDAQGDSITFSYFGAYLRDIKLTNELQQIYTNEENLSILYEINQMSQIASTKNDLLFITRDRAENYPFGTWKIGNTSIDSIEFTLGLGELLPYASGQNLGSSHPLYKGNNVMYDSTNTRFRSFFVKYSYSSIKDSAALNIPWEEKVKFSSPLHASIGEDLTVNVVWDLKKLFSGIAFRIDDRTTIENKIKANIKNSIYLK